MRLTVLGLGIFAPHQSACMAELGHEVLGVEVDRDRLAKLTQGELPFYEPGLSELLGKHIASGRLQVTDSYEHAADWGDVFFVAVGTPPKMGENSADLSQVEAVIEEPCSIVEARCGYFRKVDRACRHSANARVSARKTWRNTLW